MQRNFRKEKSKTYLKKSRPGVSYKRLELTTSTTHLVEVKNKELLLLELCWKIHKFCFLMRQPQLLIEEMKNLSKTRWTVSQETLLLYLWLIESEPSKIPISSMSWIEEELPKKADSPNLNDIKTTLMKKNSKMLKKTMTFLLQSERDPAPFLQRIPKRNPSMPIFQREN